MWFVYFGDFFKAKLAARTVVDLIADVGYAKVGINLSARNIALPWRFQTLCLPPLRRSRLGI